VYSQLAKELAEKAVKDYWDGEKIFTVLSETGEHYYCDALMPLRVIVLEDMLPKQMQEYIVKKITEHHLCKGGIASEAVDSPMFIENGYWRGAVWAPDVVMFVYALRNLGYNDLATQIAENYKSSVTKYGFSENTSALTGKQLRCKCYSWAVNAYQIL
jgi:glycogen debranching enzyme